MVCLYIEFTLLYFSFKQKTVFNDASKHGSIAHFINLKILRDLEKILFSPWTRIVWNPTISDSQIKAINGSEETHCIVSNQWNPHCYPLLCLQNINKYRFLNGRVSNLWTRKGVMKTMKFSWLHVLIQHAQTLLKNVLKLRQFININSSKDPTMLSIGKIKELIIRRHKLVTIDVKKVVSRHLRKQII